MKQIALTKKKFALVDDDDYEFLNQWNWHYHSGGYAGAWLAIQKGEKRKHLLMHRLINNTPEGSNTDHINGNPLDNRKDNLRSCTQSQNLANRHGITNTSSKYKGVSWDKAREKWSSKIRYQYKTINLGRFDCEKKAALSYNKAAKELFGEFSYLNEVA